VRFFFLLMFAGLAQAQSSGMFKDLRSYYNACGLLAVTDPKYEACNPPNLPQIMENFQKDPKNLEDMKKISRFHMTHSLQTPAKMSLLALHASDSKDLKDLKSIWKDNHSFVITFSPKCGSGTSLDFGQQIAGGKVALIKEAIKRLDQYPCLQATHLFTAFAVGIVDETLKPDVWTINQKREVRHLLSSTGATPFLE
jgi:hypothetical protein